MESLKYVKWALLLASVLSVYLVDKSRWEDLSQRAVIENSRDLEMVWDVTAKLVEAAGLDALPIQEQELWESLDIYVLDSDDARFLTRPRFEPMRTLVSNSLEPDYKGRIIDCWTTQVHLTRNGEKGVGTHADYRGVGVIAAYGLVQVPGRTKRDVMLVEMDVTEAQSVSLSWWHWLDFYILSGTLTLTGLIVWFVHRQRRLLDQNMAATNAAAERLIEKYKQQRSSLGDEDDECNTSDLLDELTTLETVSDWQLDEIIGDVSDAAGDEGDE